MFGYFLGIKNIFLVELLPRYIHYLQYQTFLSKVAKFCNKIMKTAITLLIVVSKNVWIDNKEDIQELHCKLSCSKHTDENNSRRIESNIELDETKREIEKLKKEIDLLTKENIELRQEIARFNSIDCDAGLF